jgi:hypothetical protein
MCLYTPTTIVTYQQHPHYDPQNSIEDSRIITGFHSNYSESKINLLRGVRHEPNFRKYKTLEETHDHKDAKYKMLHRINQYN